MGDETDRSLFPIPFFSAHTHGVRRVRRHPRKGRPLRKVCESEGGTGGGNMKPMFAGNVPRKVLRTRKNYSRTPCDNGEKMVNYRPSKTTTG